MNEHTKGLLRVGHSGAVVADHPIPEMSGSDATEYYGGHLVAESVTAANARRLVACWNACHGLPTDELEQKGLVAAVGNQMLDLERDRDDWQKALGAVLATIPNKDVVRASGSVMDAVAYFKRLHQHRDTLIEELEAQVRVMAESLREAVSVLSSINHGGEHEVNIEGDEPAFWQRGEWVEWAKSEVLPKLQAALAGKLPAQHSDETAVDRFAVAMKAKLAAAREKGRGGWDDPEACSVEFLADLLAGHVGKGNPGNFEDIANLAMMLHQRGADPAVLAGKVPVPVAPEGWQLVPVEATMAMISAATAATTGFGTRAQWDAMLAAAPKQQGGESCATEPPLSSKA